MSLVEWMVGLNTLTVEILEDLSFSEFLSWEQFDANDARHDALKERLIGDRVEIPRKTVVCEVCDIQKIISKYSEY